MPLERTAHVNGLIREAQKRGMIPAKPSALQAAMNSIAEKQKKPASGARKPEISLADDLTDAQYEIADRIVPWLEAHPGVHNRSAIARGVKADHQEVSTALAWLDRNQMIAGDGNKSWRKYGVRR